MKPQRGDWAVAALVLAAALCLWLIPGMNRDPAEFARIRVDGELVQTLDLRGGDADYAVAGVTIRVQDRRVCILQADCPDQVCVRTGWISRPGQGIVCVPNRVAVEIDGALGVDAVAGG